MFKEYKRYLTLILMSKVNSDAIARKKAELISAGRIFIPSNIRMPFPLSKSTAGPGAGTPGLVFSLDGKSRVKLGVVKEKITPFELRYEGEVYNFYKNDELFIENVKLIPTLLHAPSQAFINIDNQCVYNCKFCASPHLDPTKLKNARLTNEKWAELIINASKDKNFESVAITSAVPETPDRTVSDMIEIIEKVKLELGKNAPIGVEPYITDISDIDRLYEAGATELKLNIQSYDRDIFNVICPGLDYNMILQAIEYGVKIFGRNNVCSNLIIGLGETDENVLDGIEHLAKLGVVVNLRTVRVNDYNRTELIEALGHEPAPVEPDRLLKLANAQLEILNKYELVTTSFKTMCHKCGCCDIVPQHDI
jgi:biotin synthase-related radical SAM superfamily protein